MTAALWMFIPSVATYVGDDEFGHARFETTRSQVGELLYRLKYKSDQGVVAELADTAASFVRTWLPRVDLLVPVPPSRHRAVQPVLVVAEGRKILLFDDLFRSGATLNSITAALYEQGQASEVFALTITRTRSKG